MPHSSNYQYLIHQAQTERITRYTTGAVISVDNLVLLLRRKADDFLGGLYEIPGGGVEQNEQLTDAVSREVEEETGLQVKDITAYLGSFDYPSKTGIITRQFNFAVDVQPPIHVQLSEHDAYRWIAESEIERCGASDEVKRILQLFFKNGK